MAQRTRQYLPEGAVIAVDLDNVIGKTDPRIREIIAGLCGIELSQEDIRSWAYSDALVAKGIDLAAAKRIEDESFEIFHTRECLEVELLDGAIEALARIKERRHQVRVVTSRPEKSAELTQSWLITKRVPYSELVFARRKQELASSWFLLIEDNSDHAKAVANERVRVHLLDYPWNRDIEPHGLITRVRHWSEINALLLGGLP